jgi:hypothetical protein
MDPNEESKRERYQRQQIEREGGHEPLDVDEEFAQEVAAPVRKADVHREDDTEFAEDAALPSIRYPSGERRLIRHRDVERSREESEERTRQGSMLGWISLIVGIASLFFWPALLGSIAMLSGIFAWIRGSRALGSWAIVLGFISIVAYFLLVPYYT